VTSADVWVRADQLTVVVAPDAPVVMPRRFRRARADAEVVAEGISIEIAGGQDVAIVGPDAATAAVASALAGVATPRGGVVRSSHPIVAVLRRRARPLVDQRVHRAIDRELRLRGVRAPDRSMLDEAAELAGVDPQSWTSDLSRTEYSRLAPAAVACTDVPIVLLDGVFGHRPTTFEERLAARLARRAAEGLITIVMFSRDRTLAGAVSELGLHQVVTLPDSGIGERAAAVDDEDDADDDDLETDDDEGDERTYSIDREALTTQSFESGGLRLAVGDIHVEQPDADARHVLGTVPFRIDIELHAAVPVPAWRMLLVDVATSAVVSRVDAPAWPGGTTNVLDVAVTAGLSVGRYAVHVQGRASDEQGRYVLGGPPLHVITCKRGAATAAGLIDAEATWQS
jgi:ABC-type polysaccharide/polyol phosphate transport system ATPase subunit